MTHHQLIKFMIFNGLRGFRFVLIAPPLAATALIPLNRTETPEGVNAAA